VSSPASDASFRRSPTSPIATAPWWSWAPRASG
jgi:hypothetical protein